MKIFDNLHPFSRDIWDITYRFDSEKDIYESLRRCFLANSKVEMTDELQEQYYQELCDCIENLCPGGRVLANLGVPNRLGTTLMNCFVHNVSDIKLKDADSIKGIYTMLEAQAQTLKSEGGYGSNFSWIRPAGAYIKGIDSRTPGVNAFLQLWDLSSSVVTSGFEGHVDKREAGEKKKIRKGAQMWMLSAWHPEIFEFIRAKQTPGRFTKANMSVAITEGFMDCLKNDEDWSLVFPHTDHPKYSDEWDGVISHWKHPVKTYKTVKARTLWDEIMQATYTRNEPGVFFADLANLLDPVSYLPQYIHASNPCLHGDTLIAVADGRNAVTIKELAEQNEPFDVYSVVNGRVLIARAEKAFLTKKNAQILEIVLDDNSSIKVTPDHLFMLRDGSYRRADELAISDSLMPFNSYLSNGRYRQIASNTGRDRRQYRMIAEFNNLIVDPKTTAIHHVNFNSLDDSINNLKSMSHDEHINLHKEKMIGLNNPYHKMNEEWKKNFASHSGIRNHKYCGKTNEELRAAIKNLILSYGRQISRSEYRKYARENKLPITFSKFRKESLGSLVNLIKELTNECGFEVFDRYELKAKIYYNHKVKEIRKAGVSDVYDIIVPGSNNFGIITSFKDHKYITSSGVFVHNCGEVPKVTGVCCLGNLILCSFVEIGPDGPYFDWPKFRAAARIGIRFLDNVLDASKYPLPVYREKALEYRRIGQGVIGLGSLHYMLGIRYGSEESKKFVKELFKTKAEQELIASAELGLEKGSFPLFDKEKFFSTYWWKNLDISPEVKEYVESLGAMRNSHRSMVAPTGNTGVLCNIQSGGIEPVFGWSYYRWAIVPEWEIADLRTQGMSIPNKTNGEFFETKDLKFTYRGDEKILKGSFGGRNFEFDTNRGLVREELIEDFGWKFAQEYYTDEQLQSMVDSKVFVTADELTPDEHLDILAICSHYTDLAISKTINVKSDISYESFKHIYERAYELKIKGLTTYRAGTMTVVLEKIEEQDSYTKLYMTTPGIIVSDALLPDQRNSQLSIVEDGKNKWYLHTDFLDNNYTMPIALWVNTNSEYEDEDTEIAEHLIDDIEALCIRLGVNEELVKLQSLKYSHQDNVVRIVRVIGLALRHKVPIVEIVEILESYNKQISSFLYHVRKHLSKYIPDQIETKQDCPSCKAAKLSYESGCKLCRNCGYSIC